jgi:hypothetical protein
MSPDDRWCHRVPIQPKEIQPEQWEAPSDATPQFVPKLDIYRACINPICCFTTAFFCEIFHKKQGKPFVSPDYKRLCQFFMMGLLNFL